MVSRKRIAICSSGQSNELGTHSAPTDNQLLLPYCAYPIESAYIVNDTTYLLEQLRHGVNQKADSLDDLTSNEVAAWHLSNELNVDLIGIAKYAVGATSAWDDWYIGSPYLRELIRQIRALKASGEWDEYHFKWVQGERDVTYPTVPYSYSENWGYQVTDIVNEIESETDVVFRTITVVALNESINKNSTAIGYQRSEAFRLASEDKRYRVIDANSLELYSDDLHYTAQGQIKLGLMYSNIILNK